MTDFFLRDDLARGELNHVDSAGELLSWAQSAARHATPEYVYRDMDGRRTVRVQLGERAFFVKYHAGVGWREIWKNLLQARLPVLGAATEYHALLALHRIGICAPQVAAFAERGRNPARRRSVIVTQALNNTQSLEDVCATWLQRPPSALLRMALLREVATISRQLHDAGINHRDFYLCHFHLALESIEQSNLRCYLIDLHRAQMRVRTPRRWRVKDVAGLYYSAMECGLSQRDKLRFMRHYTPGGLRVALGKRRSFWRKVERRARALYYKKRGVHVEQLQWTGEHNDK